MEQPIEEKQKFAKDASWEGDVFHGWSTGEVLYGESGQLESFMFNASRLEEVRTHEFFGEENHPGIYDFTIEMKKVLSTMLRGYALAVGIEETFF
eukprot:TRINITY_DN1952_c0_g1_i2.p1 TRINITY_DN1952_c0_g1~~TRINITY_DN1952_c0_g1_i2.p1  ORF type:complete len:95 (+),score=26.26 TRINITY_DN1952_c0_g1_i2:367-651(+)